MTTATIQPLRSGAAVLEMDGYTREFPNWSDAVAVARREGVPHTLLPFPPLSVDVEVLAVAPALRVLP